VGGISYNFSIRGVGPICRVDVNGSIHKNCGRTHKHSLQREIDPRRNLPDAIARPELSGLTARQVWQVICEEAGIKHLGEFMDPEGVLS